MKWGRSRIFLVLCGSFVVGIFLAPMLSFLHSAITALFFIALTSIFWDKRQLRLIGFIGIFVLLGVLRFNSSLPDKTDQDFVTQLFDQKAELIAVVVEDPDVRARQINLTVQPERYKGKVLLSVGRYPEYRYGDKLKVSGKVEEPFESDEFSYKDYLSRFGTFATMRFPEIEVLEQKKGNPLKAGLLGIKHKFLDVISRILPEPHSAFVLGLIIGLKKAIPEDLNQAFILTGVSHIVVVSGYNISIITRSLLRTRSWLGKKVAVIISVFAVFGFVVITGAEASVVRAATMGMLLVLAMNVGRIYYVVNSLVFVGALMVFFNPQILRFDIGFQLSFLATLGLILLSPIFEKWLAKLPNFLEFRTNLASTLAAQVFVLPLLIFYFDRVSLVAPLVNVLVLWAIPYTMFLGFFTGVLGMIYLPLGHLLSGLGWILLEYMIRVVEFFATIQFASVSVKIAMPVILFFYLLLGSWLWYYKKTRRFYQHLEYTDAEV